MATEKRVPFSLPQLLADQIEKTAKAENTTPDRFLEEAVKRELLLRRHNALKRIGQQRAAENKITEDIVPRLIAESRER